MITYTEKYTESDKRIQNINSAYTKNAQIHFKHKKIKKTIETFQSNRTSSSYFVNYKFHNSHFVIVCIFCSFYIFCYFEALGVLAALASGAIYDLGP